MKPIFYTIGDSFTRGVRTDEPNKRKKFHDVTGNLGSYGDWLFKNLNRKFNRHINLSKGGNSNKDIIRTTSLLRENLLKEDFVLICLTNPGRGKSTDLSDKEVVKEVINDINNISEILGNYNYLITFAFSSLVPYWTSERVLKRKIKDTSKIIEWAKPNNTLHDICAGTWLKENEVSPSVKSGDKNFIGFDDPNFFNPYHHLSRNFSKDFHPSTDGHELISNTLLPYIKERL